MSPTTKAAAIGSCVGVLVGMAVLAALPAFYLPGDVEVNYKAVVFKPYGKNKGIGKFDLVDKSADLRAVCHVSTMRVKCVVDLGGPQI